MKLLIYIKRGLFHFEDEKFFSLLVLIQLRLLVLKKWTTRFCFFLFLAQIGLLLNRRTSNCWLLSRLIPCLRKIEYLSRKYNFDSTNYRIQKTLNLPMNSPLSLRFTLSNQSKFERFFFLIIRIQWIHSELNLHISHLWRVNLVFTILMSYASNQYIYVYTYYF